MPSWTAFHATSTPTSKGESWQNAEGLPLDRLSRQHPDLVGY